MEGVSPSARVALATTAPVGEAATRAGEIIIGALEITNLLNAAITAGGTEVPKANTEMVVMITLRLDGPQRPRALIVPTGLTSGGLTNLLDRLSEAGLVRRVRPDGGDRRAVLIDITPVGIDVLGRLARATGTALRMATPILGQWHEHFTAMGIEVGSVPSAGAGTRRQLRQLRQVGVAGRRGMLVLSDVFGPGEPAPNHTMHILWLAAKPSGTRPRAISQITGLSSATTSELLDRLERRGFVVRLTDADDGRAVVVRATEAGRATLQRAIVEMTPLLPEFGRAFLPD